MKCSLSVLLLLVCWNIHAQVQFSDVANLAGVWDAGQNYGVSVVDFNNDGWEDLYVTRSVGANRLFRNNGPSPVTGQYTFTDVAENAGLAYEGRSRMGVWGDINNDGWMDMYLGNTNGEPDALYLNNGRNANGVVTFTEIGKKLGMNDTAKPFAVVFGDIDRDGFLDIYVTQIDASNKMWKNNGDLTFTDYTVESGTTDNFVAMGAVFLDYDNDLDLDLYLTHDSYDPNLLYQNDGTGHFINVAPQANADVAAFGMGVDFGDINNDGYLDIYITNFGFNNLLLNNGDGTFQDITNTSVTGDPGMGWGTAFLDTDNSSWQDIYVANTAAVGNPNIMYQNQGDNTFVSISDNSPLESGANGFGVATFDYNLDGRTDFFVANSSGDGSIGNHLFENETQNGHHWLKVKTRGMLTNRNGIGARIEVIAGGQKYIDEVAGGSGWCSQNSLVQHFGLGTVAIIDTLRVIWPSGIVDVRTQLEADRIYTVVEGEKLETTTSEVQNQRLRVELFPNPASSRVEIRCQAENATGAEISLWNVHGKRLKTVPSGQIAPGAQFLSFATDYLPSGLYVVKIQTSEGTVVRPLIISR